MTVAMPLLVLFPDSNLRTAKRRPALVVQAEGLDTGLSQTIVAMITSNMGRSAHPSRIVVPQATPLAREMGLLTDSVVMTDNLVTILNIEIDRVIGHCGDMAAVDAALCHTLGLGK